MCSVSTYSRGEEEKRRRGGGSEEKEETASREKSDNLKPIGRAKLSKRTIEYHTKKNMSFPHQVNLLRTLSSKSVKGFSSFSLVAGGLRILKMFVR